MWNLGFVLAVKHPAIAFRTYHRIRSFVTFHGIFMGPGYRPREAPWMAVVPRCMSIGTRTNKVNVIPDESLRSCVVLKSQCRVFTSANDIINTFHISRHSSSVPVKLLLFALSITKAVDHCQTNEIFRNVLFGLSFNCCVSVLIRLSRQSQHQIPSMHEAF